MFAWFNHYCLLCKGHIYIMIKKIICEYMVYLILGFLLFVTKSCQPSHILVSSLYCYFFLWRGRRRKGNFCTNKIIHDINMIFYMMPFSTFATIIPLNLSICLSVVTLVSLVKETSKMLLDCLP